MQGTSGRAAGTAADEGQYKHKGPEERELECEEDVLPSAFEDKPLCVPRQLAELQLSVEEVCADFDAMLPRLEAPGEFCVWRNAPRVSQLRELLYSVPAALCKEIARAATEELAERLSIPDWTVRASSNPTSLEQSFFSMFLHVFLGGATQLQK